MGKHILEFFISDIITASIISAVFLMISNKKAENLDKEDEKRLQEMKDHIDQKIDQAVLQVQKDIITNIDRLI